LHKKLKIKINYELSQIEKLIEKSQTLFQKCKLSEPDFIETSAFASVMHSFYTGIESIFILIAKSIDKKVSEGERWHKALLKQMSKEIRARDAVISDCLYTRLIDYLEFRHFFRHAYGFMVDWSKMKKLFNDFDSTWEIFRKEIRIFIGKL